MVCTIYRKLSIANIEKIVLNDIPDTEYIDLSFMAYIPAVSNLKWVGGVNAIRRTTKPSSIQRFYIGSVPPGTSVRCNASYNRMEVSTFLKGSTDVFDSKIILNSSTEDVDGQIFGTSIWTYYDNEFKSNYPGGSIVRAAEIGSSGANGDFYIFAENAKCIDGYVTGITSLGFASSTLTKLFKLTLSDGIWYVLSDNDSEETIDFIASAYSLEISDVEQIASGVAIVYAPFDSSLEMASEYLPWEYKGNPYNPGGVSGPGGGGGSFDGGPTDDPTIFIPNGTTEDNASLSRIYTRYVLDSADLAIVGSRLWATDVINDIINTISKLFSSPFESIISLLSFPFDISSMLGYSAAKQVMTWGNSQFILDGLFDWGEISIESFYDGFLDYAPYTKMELYLPWGTGVVSIDPNECTPGKIRIQSNIELDKGTAVHIVTSEFTRDGRAVKEILGTYGTVVGKQIPITALDNAGKAHAVASVAVTAGAIALAGGGGAAATTSASALTAGASTTALSTSVLPAQLAPIVATDMYPLIYTPKSEEFKITPEDIKLATEGINAAMTPGHVARNGSFMTGSAGLLPTTPFLIISRPEQSVPENYGHYYGYPSNIYSKLSDLSGFTQVGSIHLENIVCTEKEREELMTLLQGGVLL